MTAGILGQLDALLTALTADEINAAADPADLNVPGVLVAIESVSPNLLSGDGTVVFRLNLCVANTAWRDALISLDTLLANVAAAVDLDVSMFPETLVVSGAELPSLRGTVTTYYEGTD